MNSTKEQQKLAWQFIRLHQTIDFCEETLDGLRGAYGCYQCEQIADESCDAVEFHEQRLDLLYYELTWVRNNLNVPTRQALQQLQQRREYHWTPAKYRLAHYAKLKRLGIVRDVLGLHYIEIPF